MPTLFCMHCGKPNSYTATKPSQCSKCSRGFTVAAAPAVATTSSWKPEVRTTTPIVTKPEDIDPVEALAKFGVAPLGEDDIEVQSESISFNSIMRDPSIVDKRGAATRGKTKRKSKKALAEEFYNEAK